MALTPVKFSALTSVTLPWAGTERLPLVKNPGAGDANYKATILQIHRLVPYAFSGIPSAATQGAGQLIYLSDGGDGLPCAALSDGTNWWPVGLPTWDVGAFYPGTPITNELIQKVMVTRTIIFPANFSGAFGDVEVNPTSTYDIDVQDDGVSIGTISIATTGVFTFTTASGTAKTVDNGSILTFVGQTTVDATIEGIAFTLAARQTVTS